MNSRSGYGRGNCRRAKLGHEVDFSSVLADAPAKHALGPIFAF